MPDKALQDAYDSYLTGKSRKDLFGALVAALHRHHDDIVALKINAAKTEGAVALHDAATGLADALRSAMTPRGEIIAPRRGRPPKTGASE